MKTKELVKLRASMWVMMFILISAVFISGCTNKEKAAPQQEAPKAVVQAPKKESAKDKESKKEETQEAKTYTYDPTGKRDPFVVPDAPAPECTPQTCYNLDQMRVDCIIWGSGMDAAHVILPNNDAIIVKKGDELGINHGRVKSINDGQIVVEEIYVDPIRPQEIHIIEKILKMQEIGKRGKRG